ncbi:MAG: tRNA preQ1(34) S-adenosylmethionine ribosyltransferase-isomerase QueA [Phycisphaerae bacterium]|nr:tRNA preQ1(34) S-adenosylmethionine ribosyltransferase-isomerase QueA [Phycisphaerae bacterium]
MDIELFDFDLPPEQIAQAPLADRAAARLLRLRRETGRIEHHTVRDLPALLRPGDLLVLNETAVVPAKLSLRRATGGRVGGLFLREIEQDAPGELRWLVLLNSKGRLRIGETLAADGDLATTLTVDSRTDEGQFEVSVRGAGGATIDILSRIGQTPLPPYIRRQAEQAEDRTRYQTVFARRPGAVAAPTAGLHFTDGLLAELAGRSVEIARVTLHVGLGTFEPVRAAAIEVHHMHSEWFDCPAATADAVNAARAAGRRVVAVGTTSVRVLESCADEAGRVRPRAGWTDIFIYPGYRFRAVDALLTNFHLPRSTLLMLVAALAGRERIMNAYREAVAAGYRFFSYGDAMLIE